MASFRKILNHDSFAFEKSAVLKPTMVEANYKVTNVVISSADRSLSQYPTPSDYVAPFYEDILDVASIELKVAALPRNPYNVHRYCDRLQLLVGSAQYNVTVPHGAYDQGDTLANALTVALNTAIAGATFTVTWSQTSLSFTLQADQPFTIVNNIVDADGNTASYIPNGIGKLLGFAARTYESENTSPGVYVTTSQYPVTSFFLGRGESAQPIVLHVDSAQTKSSVNNTLNKCFAFLLSGSAMRDAVVGGGGSDTYSIKKVFNPVLARMDRLRIRFTDLDGNLYDFGNQDHVLEFIIESQQNTRNLSTYMG